MTEITQMEMAVINIAVERYVEMASLMPVKRATMATQQMAMIAMLCAKLRAAVPAALTPTVSTIQRSKVMFLARMNMALHFLAMIFVEVIPQKFMKEVVTTKAEPTQSMMELTTINQLIALKERFVQMALVCHVVVSNALREVA
jgi:hypothetical protein